MTAPIVLLDLTLLNTPTRFRGIGRYIVELCRGLVEALEEDDSVMLHAVEHIPLTGRVEVTDEPLAALDRLLTRERPRLSRWAWAYQARLRMREAIRHTNADLLHVPHTDATPLHKVGVRRLVTAHDLIPLRFPRKYCDWRTGFGPGRRVLDARRYRTADHIVAISRGTSDDLQSILSVPSSKITVVPNAVDRDALGPEPEPEDAARTAALALVPGEFLLYVGDADWRKNAEGMFDGLAKAVPPPGVTAPVLAWAGVLSEESRARVRALAEASGVATRVKFLDWVPDETLRALYRNALGLLFVSRAEGFGLPVVEAMACGCPVITSNGSSLREIGLGAARLVDPESADEIARAIEALYDPATRDRLQAAGPPRAARYGRPQQAEAMLEVYREQTRLSRR